MFPLSSKENEIMYDICKECNHGMLLHGNEHGEGYCSEGNGDWCDCKVKGLSYDEEISILKNEQVIVNV